MKEEKVVSLEPIKWKGKKVSRKIVRNAIKQHYKGNDKPLEVLQNSIPNFNFKNYYNMKSK